MFPHWLVQIHKEPSRSTHIRIEIPLYITPPMFLLQITSFLTSLIRTASDLETYVVSVERVDEYMNCPNEVRIILYM